MAFGVGAKGTRIAEGTIYEKLRGLQAKGIIEILDVTRSGTRIRLRPPMPIPGIVPTPDSLAEIEIETLDFFNIPKFRQAIFERESWRCFYCLRRLDAENSLLEHVVSAPLGERLPQSCRGMSRL